MPRDPPVLSIVQQMDALPLLIQVLFYLLLGVALRRYLRDRAAVELGVVAVFSTTAALFLLSIVSAYAPALAGLVRPLGIAALVAQPFLIVRLLDKVWKVPPWATWLAFAGFVVSTAGLLGLGNRNIPAILVLVAYFGITESLAAVQFARLARARRGAHRVRLACAGVATALFGFAIVIAGLGSAVNGGAGGGPTILVLGRLAALLAALGYLAAFVPPAWFTEFLHRANAFDLARRVVSIEAGQHPSLLWGQLAEAAGSILGASDIRILDAAGRPIDLEMERPPTPDSISLVVPDQEAGGSVRQRRGIDVSVPLVVDGKQVATLSAHLDGQPLFVEDDIAIVSLLGSLTARAVQHDEDVARLRATELALEESAALRASEGRFRVLLEADPNAILAADESGRVIWATRSSAELFGCPDGSLIGRQLTDLVAVPEGQQLVPEMATDQIHRFETTATRADGSILPVEAALRQLDLDGRPTTVAIIADATWRHEANEIRDRFVGMLSHELRTPITSIYGGAQVLLKRGTALDPVSRDELLMGLADESERLQRIIENLLVLDRVERGADFFGPRPILIQRVLADVIEHERALWPSLDLQLEIPEGLPVVTGDDDQVAQVMRNLLSNAVKYAGHDATITVRAGFDHSTITVTVTDDGPGFPAVEADQLFGLYYRSTRSSGAPGAGIGLYVCRSLVEAMGGSIWARSAPSGGAEFGFTLAPYVDADEPAAVALSPEAGVSPADPTSDQMGWAAAAS